MGVKVPAPDMVKWFYWRQSIAPGHRLDIYRECTEMNGDELDCFISGGSLVQGIKLMIALNIKSSKPKDDYFIKHDWSLQYAF